MRRLKILIWHVHGSYLHTLAHIDHDWFTPVKPNKPEGYLGRGRTFDSPQNLQEIPADQVSRLDLDLVIYQTPKNLFEDRREILSTDQLRLPGIYLEHNTPRNDPANALHPTVDAFSRLLLVHVTHFNRLMWDSADMPVEVVEHSVALDPRIRYIGDLPRGLTMVNGMQGRPRISGLDIFEEMRRLVPLDLVGMQTEHLGGMGDVPYRDLHALACRYRFLFSPMRYTSLPLAVIEAMTIGMPVVALATTELPTVIVNGENGYVSCDSEELAGHMLQLLSYPEEARRLGRNARELATTRFGLDRFARSWNHAFHRALTMAEPDATELVPAGPSEALRRSVASGP